MCLFSNDPSLLTSGSGVFRVISLGDRGEMGLPQGDDVKFENMWKTLIAGDAPVCARTGVIHTALPKPQAVFLDVRVMYTSSLNPDHESTRLRLLDLRHRRCQHRKGA